MSVRWEPGGARAALGLSFDNLGEAAEIGVGALAPDDPRVGSHRTASEVVPMVLERLDAAGLHATFFVEGLNAELYPDLLREIDGRGHELAYHAWSHEQWGALDAADQASNLDRGIAAFALLGLDLLGIRPPGGGLGEGGPEVPREMGMSYASPAGEGAGAVDGIALLPFSWRHVDATCVLPQLGGIREQMTGSTDPIEPVTFVDYLEKELAALTEQGGFMTIVLHPFMLEWLGDDRLSALLERIATASASRGLWAAPLRDIAARILGHPEEFSGGTTLDPTSWS
jgi:peptidoglycan/xylan/chitin deacetylase (PgdA/CDA1 family)